jgi:hypothetical protein
MPLPQRNKLTVGRTAAHQKMLYIVATDQNERIVPPSQMSIARRYGLDSQPIFPQFRGLLFIARGCCCSPEIHEEKTMNRPPRCADFMSDLEVEWGLSLIMSIVFVVAAIATLEALPTAIWGVR